MNKYTRKVHDRTIKVFGSQWRHEALRPYNGKDVTVKADLNEDHQTELTVTDGDAVVCIITPKGRL
jgi:hypothetical protein